MTEKLDAIAKDIIARIDKTIERELYGATTNQGPTEPTSLNAADMIRQWERAIRNFDRTAVTFQVDLVHPGPMLRRERPHNGTIIECSWVQANEVHKHWPLKLWKVLSEHAAEFVPVDGVFPEFVTAILPAPPYDLPEAPL